LRIGSLALSAKKERLNTDEKNRIQLILLLEYGHKPCIRDNCVLTLLCLDVCGCREFWKLFKLKTYFYLVTLNLRFQALHSKLKCSNES